MGKNNVVSTQKINQASGGNMYLKEILGSLAQTTNLQQQVTNTGKKNVPPQCKANVSLLSGSYIVEIQNPGTVQATSALQAAQTGGGSAPNVGITPIYHQIRCANTPAFSISSNVQTFGGTTGSVQTMWTLVLAAGQWYFQIRSSYDGVNFNTWKNANGGQALNAKPETVTTEETENAVFGVFTLPGAELVAIGAGLVPDLQGFTLPDDLYTSAMVAIAGPNGFTDYGHPMHGVSVDQVNINVPDDTSGLIGPADYPVSVPMKYRDGEGNLWPGSSNIFALAFDPLGNNVRQFFYATGNWAVFQMPGGWSLGFGSGQVASGTTISLPPGFMPADMLSIVSPGGFTDTGHPAHGVRTATMDANGTVTLGYQDGSGNYWTGPGNWFAVAYSPGVPVEPVSNGTFVVFTLPSGRLAAIGAGNCTSGVSFGLPTGLPGSGSTTGSTLYPTSYADSGGVATQYPTSLYHAGSSSPAILTSTGSGGTGQCQWDAFASVQSDGLTLSVTVTLVSYANAPPAPTATITYTIGGTTYTMLSVSGASGATTVQAVLPSGFNLNTLVVTGFCWTGINATASPPNSAPPASQVQMYISDMHVSGTTTPVGGDGGTGGGGTSGGGGSGSGGSGSGGGGTGGSGGGGGGGGGGRGGRNPNIVGGQRTNAVGGISASISNSTNVPLSFNVANLLGIATPSSFVDTGHPAHGISRCGLVGNTPQLLYEDGSGNSWSGNCNWLCFVWE